MSRILVIDDSLPSRQVIGDILRDKLNAHVNFASDRQEALHRAEHEGPFQLIISDLQLPNLDGLELLNILRQRFPKIPVVILTALGNEEVAFQAIQEGAASYVPKPLISNHLPNVVRTVLNAASRRELRSRLAQHLTCHEIEFHLPNDRELLSAAVAELLEVGHLYGVFGDPELTRMGVALEEALSNAMIHGNLEISSELRARDDGSYEEAIRVRQAIPTYGNRRIQLRCRLTAHEARFEITDEGPGFDVTQVPDPTDPANFFRPSGRGLLLIRSFMDEAFFNPIGNKITLIKRKTMGAPPPEH
ncbi:MAG: response regulator [Planctomycetes bacterium]|nr:response regulator [Planctomycetota bacterium]